MNIVKNLSFALFWLTLSFISHLTICMDFVPVERPCSPIRSVYKQDEQTPKTFQTFSMWAKACSQKLGRYTFKLSRKHPQYDGDFKTPLSKEEFEETISQYLAMIKMSSFNSPAHWLIQKQFTRKTETINQKGESAGRSDRCVVYKIMLATKQTSLAELIITTINTQKLQQKITISPIGPMHVPNQSLFDETQTNLIDGFSLRRNLFVQRLLLQKNAQVIVIPDLHGDAHSLIKYLQDLIEKGDLDDNFVLRSGIHIVFTGDYSDRGPNGTEVLYMAMKLKIANPERVILLRGNHESFKTNEKSSNSIKLGSIGLTKELNRKFGYSQDDFIRKIVTIYDLLPSALYVGTPNEENIANYALVCHGAPDIRFDPRPLLSYPEKTILYQKIDFLHGITSSRCWLRGKPTFYHALKKSLPSKKRKTQWLTDVRGANFPEANTFSWGDFMVGPKGKAVYFSDNAIRSVSIGKRLITGFLKACQNDYTYQLQEKAMYKPTEKFMLRTIIRAHQHSGAMGRRLRRNHGIYNSWTDSQWGGIPDIQLSLTNSPVWTLMVSPESMYGRHTFKYNWGTYARLRLQPQFENWTLEPVKAEIFPEFPEPTEPETIKSIFPRTSSSKDSTEPVKGLVRTRAFSSPSPVTRHKQIS